MIRAQNTNLVQVPFQELVKMRNRDLIFQCASKCVCLISMSYVFKTAVAPVEILAQGDSAKLLYEKALMDGFVTVYRGRILFIGQDGAGKTSLKKSLLGLRFDPKERSTEGIQVDPSTCEIEIDQIKNWCSTGENKPGLSEFVSRMLAERRYHAVLNEQNEDSGTESEEERPTKSNKESMVSLEAEDEKNTRMNEVCSFQFCISLCAPTKVVFLL